MADGGGVLTEGRVALRGRSLSVGVVGGDQGAACMGQGVMDLEACVREANAGILQATEPPHCIWAVDGGSPRRRIHLVLQGVEPRAVHVGVEGAGGGGGGVATGQSAAILHEVPLERVLWFPASLLGRDVPFAISKVPRAGPEPKGGVGRGAPGGEGHPRRVPFRRVGVVQP